MYSVIYRPLTLTTVCDDDWLMKHMRMCTMVVHYGSDDMCSAVRSLTVSLSSQTLRVELLPVGERAPEQLWWVQGGPRHQRGAAQRRRPDAAGADDGPGGRSQEPAGQEELEEELQHESTQASPRLTVSHNTFNPLKHHDLQWGFCLLWCHSLEYLQVLHISKICTKNHYIKFY